MKLRALVRDRESIERFLRHQNLWTEPLGLAEARPPPYFRSVTRLRPSPQVELFEYCGCVSAKAKWRLK
jgi:hypothetical protein